MAFVSRNLSKAKAPCCKWSLRGIAFACLLATSGAAADPVAFKISQNFSARGLSVPYTLYLRLTEVAQSRMGIDAFIDLRQLQRKLPRLLSQVLDETCKHKYAVAITETRAQGDAITVSGQFQAKFYTCDDKDPKVHYRGVLLLGQNVNFTAKASANVSRQCIRLRLLDVQLDPKGFLGGAADLFGLTEKAQTLILEKGEEVLAKHPICPKMPPELAMLDPYFNAGGIREIDAGGIGAALHGSVDTSSETMLSLLSLMQEKGLIDG